jgi:hypothetical protein
MKSIEIETANRRRWGAISICVAIAGGAILFAAPTMRADDQAAGTRAVHLSYVEGQVRVTQGDQVIAEGATANMPLFEGMQVSAEQDGRAEIQFEDGSVVRLSPNSTVTLTVLRGEGASGDAEMQLNGGLAYFEFQGSSQAGQFTVHFGDSSVTPTGNALLRVRMDTPPGDLAVFSGNVDLNRGNGGVQLAMHGGESVTLYANDVSRYDLNESIDPDSWDAWNTDRDQAMATVESASTAAPPSQSGPESGSPAWSDLDANGSWYDVPDQGYVWSPYDAANPGFDPYGCGNWMSYPQYGYMFVPCNSWGFLPYSCGSWNFFSGFGWGWNPGYGGCNPWWFGGGFYPGPRIGSFPPGYRPPHRPIGPGGPHYPGHPVPVIAVNRLPRVGATPYPSREHGAPVTIAGNTVTPMRPVIERFGEGRAPAGSPRLAFSVFDGNSKPNSSQGRPVYPGGRPTPGVSSGGTEHGTTVAHSPSTTPSHGSSPHPSSSGGGSHGYSGGSSHASSGGGGGGGGHAGGGGGGGGGGGAHK